MLSVPAPTSDRDRSAHSGHCASSSDLTTASSIGISFSCSITLEIVPLPDTTGQQVSRRLRPSLRKTEATSSFGAMRYVRTAGRRAIDLPERTHPPHAAGARTVSARAPHHRRLRADSDQLAWPGANLRAVRRDDHRREPPARSPLSLGQLGRPCVGCPICCSAGLWHPGGPSPGRSMTGWPGARCVPIVMSGKLRTPPRLPRAHAAGTLPVKALRARLDVVESGHG